MAADDDHDAEELGRMIREEALRRTPIEPHDLYDRLRGDDAADLVWFVVGVVSLEATLGRIVARHGDRPVEEVDGATLGRLIGWAEPILVEHGIDQELIDDLRELNRVRIAVLHRLPSIVAAWGDRPVWTYVNADGAEVRVRDLYPYGTLAWLAVRERLGALAQ